MSMKRFLTTFMLTGVAALAGAAAFAQAPAAAKQSGGGFDVGVSGFWAFNSSTTGNGTKQTPTNSYGAIGELRYIMSPLLGAELAVSYNNQPQAFVPNPGACGLACQNPSVSLSNKVIQPSIAYVASYNAGNLHPFVLGGLGLFVSIPGATPYGNNTAMRPTWIVGGGVDWDLTPHLGARLQVRDNFFKAPNVSSIYPATGAYTSSLQPMGGVYYRF